MDLEPGTSRLSLFLRIAHSVFLELFDPVEVVEADMTAVARSLTPVKGPGNRPYFALKHDVILSFGASGISARTEVHAQIGWSMTVSLPRHNLLPTTTYVLSNRKTAEHVQRR